MMDNSSIEDVNIALPPSSIDLTDVICFLIPSSPAAGQEVARLATKEPYSQHIIQSPYIQRSPEIVLRLSSRSNSPDLRFLFGRNPNHCDIYFANDPGHRVSNIHFGIFIDEDGSVMLEDVSTNGTIVDNIHLKAKETNRRGLADGSEITLLLLTAAHNISFLVSIPSRSEDQQAVYENKIKSNRNLHPGKSQSTLSLGHKTSHGLEGADGSDGSPPYGQLQCIASGYFSTVFRATSKLDGKLVAVKKFYKRNHKYVTKETDDPVDRSINVMKQIHHPNIVQFVENLENDTHIILVTEYVLGGDLQAFTDRHGRLPEADARPMTSQLLNALHYLHQNLMVHADIRPSHILIQSQQPFIVKLGGFTLSQVRDNDNATLPVFAGTLFYAAPELYSEFDQYGEFRRISREHTGLKRPSYGHSIDIWSLGASIFYALTVSPPFPAKQVVRSMSGLAILDQIMTTPLDISPLLRAKCGNECVEFLRSMLQKRPEVRATIESLQVHPWLRGPTLWSGSNVGTLAIRDAQMRPLATGVEAPVSDSGYGTASNATYQLHLAKPKLTVARGGDSDQLNMETELEDNATVYSDASDVSDVRIESYSSKLVDDLVARLALAIVDEKVIDSLAESLPGLLKALASKLGHQASSQMHRDAMVFLHKHRYSITKIFQNSYCQNQEATQVEADQTSQRRVEPLTEVMDRWLVAPVSQEYDVLDDVELGAQVSTETDDDFQDNTILSGLEEYSSLISSDSGYEWLVSCLRRETIIQRPALDRMEVIRDTILQAIPQSRYISRKSRNPKGCTVAYEVDWDPFAFLAGQEYDDTDHDNIIATAITLTGTEQDAQAATCQEYLAQIWPSSGLLLLQLLQRLVRNGKDGAPVECQTPVGTKLVACFGETSLRVVASGVPHFVVEVAEQLAWIGAALRPSSETGPAPGLICCLPHIEEMTPFAEPEGHGYLSCKIKFPCRVFRPTKSDQATGQCWHGLFRMPVVVKGYPISRRPKAETGLEISLEMMAALIGSRSVERFNSAIFIKAFSAMLAPTDRIDNVVIWHLLHTQRPSDRISYLDCSMQYRDDIRLTELASARHIVGWCPEADCNIGTAQQASLSVKKSGLPKAHSTCALEKVEIQTGQFIMGTAAFSVGKREKPVHISRSGYMNKMQWISSKYVMFWDEGEKRGWLVNGARALLHLVRVSLEFSKTKFKSAFLLDPKDLADITLAAGSESALDALLDQTNRSLLLYIDKSEVYEEETTTNPASGGAKIIETVTKRQTRHYRLEDRIEHIYSILEKLIDHQTDIERRSGLQIKTRPRRQLEGWEFRDLITDGDPFFPKVATLQTVGKGWVDFTRGIHAICLFGKGFGDMIRPSHASPIIDPCPRWSRMPRDRYYLAACVSDIQEIIDSDGDDTVNPTRICDGMLWHMKQSLFQACPCTTAEHSTKTKHHDPVQVLFPNGFTGLLRPKPRVVLEQHGAVIFGHNMNLHWHWGDHGGPIKGDPPPPDPPASSDILDATSSSSSSKDTTDGFSKPSSASSPASEASVGPMEESESATAGSKRPLAPAALDPGSGLSLSSIYKRFKATK